MNLKRYSIAASTLVLLAPCLAKDNPFARWDKIQKETAIPADGPLSGAAATSRVQLPEPRTQKNTGSLEYFSPGSTATKAQVTPVATQAPATPAVAGDAVGKVTIKGMEATTGVQQAPAAIVERIQPARPRTAALAPAGGITNAGFVNTGGASGIKQTSAVQFGDDDSTPNPFAEFLNERDAGTVAVEDDTPFLPPMADEGEPEFVVPPVVENIFAAESPDAFVAKPAFQAVENASATPSGPQTPMVTLQWVYHGDFNVGQECRCDLIVENTGQSSVRNVVTEAVVPDGVEVVNSVPVPTTTAGSATWSFGELKPGQSRKVELTVVPRKQGELQMNAFVRVTGASSSSFSVRQPMIAIKVDGPASIEVGQMVNYTAIVSNPGTGEARNVVIQAVVPDGLEHRRGKMLTIEVGTLNPGESRQARLSLTATKGGDHDLAVRVVADGGLTDQRIDTVVIAEPRLNIGVRGPARGTALQPTDYEVVVANEGKVDSNNVRAKYRVPEGFDFVKADRGGKFNTEDRTIDWFVGTLEPGQVKNFNVTLQATGSGEFKHQVGVISEHGRMTMAEHLTAVQGNAKLALTVASSGRSVKTGDEVSFEIKIQNSGNQAAESVGLSCELPAGLELVDISGPSEFVADSGVVIFRALPSLAGGESAVFLVKTRCTRPGNHSARVRVASETIGKALIDEETVTGVVR